ncbi:MAG: hypothetical protein HN368_23745 [Spirochaetales bacterium]|jgi:predicted ATPase/DNA-binding SARP family transcriptional activator|nr:hypothetical protein [Spirochaetales bacterium]
MQKTEKSFGFHLYLLNSPRLEYAGKKVKLDTRKTFALLGYITLADRPHPRAYLASLLWPESSIDAAKTNLRKALSTLRKIFGNGSVIADRETVVFGDAPALWIDSVEVMRLLGKCEAHAHDLGKGCEKCLPVAERVIDLYQGPFLRGFTVGESPDFDDWVLETAEVIASKVHLGFRLACRTYRELGDFGKSNAFARRWLALDEFNEEAHRELMIGYAESGDRAAAIRQFMRCRDLFTSELDIVPGKETNVLYQRIHDAEFSVDPEQTFLSPTNLPRSLSSFVGRKSEIRELAETIVDTPLITLTGPGGTGKTHLAIEVSSRVIEKFPGGVWFSEMAGLSDPGHIPGTVAADLNIQPDKDIQVSDALIQRLSGRRTLLVLDNCEHLIDACADFAQILLGRCIELRILATSRERLRIPGEMVFIVPPLGLLSSVTSYSRLEEVRECEAIRLFAERARLRVQGFEISSDNAQDIAEICRHLQGSPLAIEMAAARSNALTPREIRVMVESQFGLLKTLDRSASARHQDLHSVFDWSYALLTAEEQELLCQLSVFRGGFALDAAEKICSDDSGSIFELVYSLIDKCMVQQVPVSDGGRYRLLEPVRQFAAEIQKNRRQDESVRDRYVAWYLNLAIEAADKLGGPDQIEWLDRLDGDRFNFIEAINLVMRKGDGNTAMRLCVALYEFWITRRYVAEGYSLIVAALDLGGDDSHLVAGACVGAGWLGAWCSDRDKSLEYAEQGLCLYRDLRCDKGIAEAYMAMAMVLCPSNQIRELDYTEKALRIWRKLGVGWGIAKCLVFLGMNISRHFQEPPKEYHRKAADMLTEALTISEAAGNMKAIASARRALIFHLLLLGEDVSLLRKMAEENMQLGMRLRDWHFYGYALLQMGTIEGIEGNLNAAEKHCRNGLDVHFRHVGNRNNIKNGLLCFVRIKLLRKDYVHSVLLYSVTCRIRKEQRNKTPRLIDKLMDELRDEMGADAYDDAFRKGEKISEAEAVHFAMTGKWQREI